ncbi:histidine triad nucleotide-binding protein [Youngiibacter fragilis]|uniref:HIT family hydrolase n=1 Tax=Youngiibacter fragilis 232.1 TaxID=994573 RepID=V7I4F5_9CLOT|nr:histidine triad nucleotide-binding protein [Youngiibacter fragilis]ETA80171.1 HIT family hydrolase [Youngiibacter fragilis 232.1]
MDCLFCRIIKGEIPSSLVYEDENIYAFRDIAPQAPVHILVVPKQHVSGINELDEVSSAIASKVLVVIRDLAKREGIAESGYRVVINTGKDGQQSVDHLHFHLLGGRTLEWPPG